jgi:hypothetical protein
MKPNFRYTEMARERYLINAGNIKLSQEDFDNIDLTREYCELAVEVNYNALSKDNCLEFLAEWVLIQSCGRADRLVIQEYLIDEFEAMAFTYHKE